jgi:hypothetical protein
MTSAASTPHAAHQTGESIFNPYILSTFSAGVIDLKRSQLLIVFLLFFPLLVVVDYFSVSAQTECLDVGTYNLAPDKHMASWMLGWKACTASVTPYEFELVFGPLILINSIEYEICYENYCVIDCIDSSITLDYDPNTPITYILDWVVYITGFTGKVLTNQSFQITVDYFFYCPCYDMPIGCDCFWAGGDASGSFTFTGTIPSVPVKATTWGHIKALFQ